MAVDILGHLLALHVTPANDQDHDQTEQMAEQVQEVTGESVEVAFVDQGYTGEEVAQASLAAGGDVVRLPDVGQCHSLKCDGPQVRRVRWHFFADSHTRQIGFDSR